MRLSDDFIRELKERNNLSDVARTYMDLKRRGRLEIGLCPFHGEKTPSFTVYPESASFFCFGCKAAGDVISFIMKAENLDYLDAVKFLAQRAGMALPEDNYDDSMSKLRQRVYEANREAARFYYKVLYSEDGAQALSYLRERGLTENTIRHFGLGYSPSSRWALSDYLRGKGFSEAELIAANLANKPRSGKGLIDRFIDRVMFPIIDVKGNVIAFGGRTMGTANAKYLNTSDTPVFSKSHNLFALNFAKSGKEHRLILCEGYMDVISLHQAGFIEAVASLGTALTSAQANLMKRYCDEAVLCYDADEAGQRATAKAIGILRDAGLEVRVLTVPDGKDPDEFMKNHGDKGPAAFRNILENSGNDVEYRLRKLKARYDMDSASGKLGYMNDALKVLVTLDNSMERDIYMSKLSDETGVDKSSIREQLNRLLQRKNSKKQQDDFFRMRNDLSGLDDKINPEKKNNLRAVKAEESLLAFLVNNPDKLKRIEERLKPDDFITVFNRGLFEYFSKRIKSALDPLNMISADFTAAEVSKIMAIVHPEPPVPDTPQAMNEFIDTILTERRKPTEDEIRGASSDDMRGFIDNLKKSRK